MCELNLLLSFFFFFFLQIQIYSSPSLFIIHTYAHLLSRFHDIVHPVFFLLLLLLGLPFAPFLSEIEEREREAKERDPIVGIETDSAVRSTAAAKQFRRPRRAEQRGGGEARNTLRSA